MKVEREPGTWHKVSEVHHFRGDFGHCGQCGYPLDSDKVEDLAGAWDDVEVREPQAIFLDCVVSRFPCGHFFIARKYLFKRPDGSFVYSAGWPIERGQP
jgi:hypothetical protein